MQNAEQGPITHFFELEGRAIAYDDTGGTGRVILSIPGMSDLRRSYRFLRPGLQKAGFRVVTMDVRGFGESSVKWDEYSAHAVGKDAIALMDHLIVNHAVICGNSFAAGAALWAAHDAPPRVDGVVLLGPMVRDDSVPWYASLAVGLGMVKLWRNWFWLTYWTSLFPLRKPADFLEVRQALQDNLKEEGRMDVLESMLLLPKADTKEMIIETGAKSGIRPPALIVMGAKDPDFPEPVKEAEWLSNELHGQLMIVDDAGHYPHVEMPEKVLPDIISFLNRL